MREPLARRNFDQVGAKVIRYLNLLPEGRTLSSERPEVGVMPKKPQDDEGFSTSAELSHEEAWDSPDEADGSGDVQHAHDPWREQRMKEQKAREKREKLLKRYRDGKL
jgi:hypothetical protein